MLKDIDWIVVPGGPGLSKDYLRKPFDVIFSRLGVNLHYYDPYGSPENKQKKEMSISDLIEQIKEVADEKKLKRFGLISHSFGTYISLRFAEKYSDFLDAMILISPMPLVYSKWRDALSDISGKIPFAIQKEIEIEAEKNDGNDGSRLFGLLFPFYSFRSSVELPRVSFSLKMCNYLSSQVSVYDDTFVFDKLDLPLVYIVGDMDPFYVSGMFPEDSTVVLKEVGHYPFYEDINEFERSLTEVDRKLCQRKITKAIV